MVNFSGIAVYIVVLKLCIVAVRWYHQQKPLKRSHINDLQSCFLSIYKCLDWLCVYMQVSSR